MKKITTMIVLVFLLLVFTACKDTSDETDTEHLQLHTLNYISDYMNTYISINIWIDENQSLDYFKGNIESIFETYHYLSTGYEPLPEGSPFKTNIYAINQIIGEKIEIDVELYEMLELADTLKELTQGYFDVSIGKIVDVWKSVILEEGGYLFDEIPTVVFNDILSQLENIDVVEDAYELTYEDDKYYVEILSQHVKIDLGALSKGVATQKVNDFLQDEGIEYYSVSSGSSSINFGKNLNRDTRLFHISLANPLRTGISDRTYGMIKASDTGFTTSGNYEQFALYQGLRYHHIISPKTKMPSHYYHTVTMVGPDSGFLDAISTALFSMNPETFDLWMAEYQDLYQIEIVRMNYDGSITTFLKNYVFEAH